MSRQYDTPPSNLRALRDRLTQAARREGIVFGRLQQHVAVLVVTQLASAVADEVGHPVLLIKGGSALELRRGISDSRTTKDVDAVARREILQVHSRLADAGEHGWNGFNAVLTPPREFEVTGAPGNPHRFVVKLSYQGRPFASIPVEVSRIEAGNADHYDAVTSEALSLVGLPQASAVPCMTVPWQIAQKLHACTEPLEPPSTNDRAHDLVDLQLLEALIDPHTLPDVGSACVSVFEARAHQAWPPTLTPQPHWAPIYRRALEGLTHLDLAPTVEAASERVGALIRRIDNAL